VGSQFCVVLKAAPVPVVPPQNGMLAQASDATQGVPTNASVAPESGAGKTEMKDPHWSRVLYIEDNAVNRALIEGYVSLRPGIALELAVDGQSGIDAAMHQTPDLILIDMMLPDLHGLQVIEALRRVPALQAVRCIAVSANAMQQQIEEARAAGFDDYLTKPVSMKLLLAELDRLA
jgi:CheY-like chemotaxis protein